MSGFVSRPRRGDRAWEYLYQALKEGPKFASELERGLKDWEVSRTAMYDSLALRGHSGEVMKMDSGAGFGALRALYYLPGNEAAARGRVAELGSGRAMKLWVAQAKGVSELLEFVNGCNKDLPWFEGDWLYYGFRTADPEYLYHGRPFRWEQDERYQRLGQRFPEIPKALEKFRAAAARPRDEDRNAIEKARRDLRRLREALGKAQRFLEDKNREYSLPATETP